MHDTAPLPGGRIRAIVADDEPPARSSLRALLQADPAVDLVAECGSGAGALAAIRRHHPDVVFLDVEMPEGDGFDVVELLGRDVPAAVVFVTAYDAYALRAFDVGAIDYVLKPFDTARFERTLARAKERIALARARPPAPQVIAVKSAGRIAFVKLNDIEWIEAADYYVRLHARGTSHLLRRSIADLERDLDGAGFCRIHRSAIVRVDRIGGFALNADGDYDVVLDTGTTLRCSRRYRKDVQGHLEARGLPRDRR